MFILDDLLLAPLKSFAWLAGKIHEAAQAELENEQERLTDRLREIYMLLETGRMTQKEFDAEEDAILTRLDQLAEMQAAEATEEEDDDELEDDEYEDDEREEAA